MYACSTAGGDLAVFVDAVGHWVPRATRQTARALRPCPLGQRCLGGIADQHVLERYALVPVCRRPAASFDQTFGGRRTLRGAGPGGVPGDPWGDGRVVRVGLKRCRYRAGNGALRDPGWGQSQGLSPEQQERQLCVAVRAGRCRELAAPNVDVPAGATDDRQSCQVRPALDANSAELASGHA